MSCSMSIISCVSMQTVCLLLTLISVFAPLTLSILIYDELLCNKLVCCVYVGVSSLENQTEADSSDVTERSHDGKPITGMSVVSDDIYSLILSRRPFFISN